MFDVLLWYLFSVCIKIFGQLSYQSHDFNIMKTLHSGLQPSKWRFTDRGVSAAVPPDKKKIAFSFSLQ